MTEVAAAERQPPVMTWLRSRHDTAHDEVPYTDPVTLDPPLGGAGGCIPMVYMPPDALYTQAPCPGERVNDPVIAWL